MKLQSLISPFIDIIFPERCVHCTKILKRTKPRVVLCNECTEKIPLLSGFMCPCCHRRLYEPRALCHRKEKFVVHATSYYASPVMRSIIHSLKYGGLSHAGETLGLLLSKTITDAFNVTSKTLDQYTIIPMPLHKSRKRNRGYNQSEIIALALHKKLSDTSPGLIYDQNAFVRIQNTPPQVEQASDSIREQNVLNAFAVKNTESIRNKNIILVDDVYTSGATMRSATEVLRKNGAREIIAAVAGRSQRES